VFYQLCATVKKGATPLSGS